MGFFKKAFIAALIFIVSVQTLIILGRINNITQIMKGYASYVFLIGIMITIAWLLYLCFGNEDEDEPTPQLTLRVSPIYQSIQRRSQLNNRRSPSRISNRSNISNISNVSRKKAVSFIEKPKRYQNGHFLIDNQQYENMTKIQTKQAIEQLMKSKEYNKYNNQKYTRYGNEISQKSSQDMLFQVRQNVLEDQLINNEELIFGSQDD